VRLMNALGEGLAHSVISAEPGALGARALIDPGVMASFPEDFPPLKGRPSPARLWALARAMRGHDLILTYNWGAMDVVMAHRLFARVLGLAPLIHHEDGFNEDEAAGLKPQRNLYRRVALGTAARLIVPSHGLERIALGAWRQPRERVLRIANGIDTAAFAAPPDPAALPLAKAPGTRWVGTLAGLRAVKNLPLLVEACAALPPQWHLVICGEGPEEAAIRAAAAAHGLMDRVHLPGRVDPARVVGLFDIFALSSRSEQFPLALAEAMAAGLPVAAPDVGDVSAMLSEPNRALVVSPGDGAALGAALARLAGDPSLRAALGAANRAHARAHYDFAAMLAAYRAAYGAAIGRAI